MTQNRTLAILHTADGKAVTKASDAASLLEKLGLALVVSEAPAYISPQGVWEVTGAVLAPDQVSRISVESGWATLL